ncbi:hypothetical protein [Terribacillus halophilus]|nr:hypothetical protein [Terribacillus halophilus]
MFPAREERLRGKINSQFQGTERHYVIQDGNMDYQASHPFLLQLGGKAIV